MLKDAYSKLNARLVRMGPDYLDQFRKTRDELKINGISEQVAWREAADRVLPNWNCATAEWIQFSKSLRLKAAKRDRPIELNVSRKAIELQWIALAQAARDKTAAKGAQLEWVLANLLIPIDKVDKAGVPSPAAVALLKWARGDGYGEFCKIMAQRLVGSKQQQEREDQFLDECATVIDAIDRCRSARKPVSEPALLPSGPEELRREPELARGNGQVGVERSETRITIAGNVPG